MSLLAKRAVIKEDKSNIITLGAIAAKAKEADSNVVNATIGMYYGEDGKLVSFKSVEKALSSLSIEQKYAYSSTPGNPDFHEAVKKWVFQDYYDEITEYLYTSVMATPGGSGAISNTFSNYLNEGDKALLPSYMWGNYRQFAYENYALSTTYELFNEQNEFNLEDVYRKMLELKNTQKRVLLVVNDPCQNPTGYCMKYEEWQELVKIINELSNDNTPIILLFDMAYIDYDYRGLDATRQIIRLFETLNPSVLAILAFSGSKTLGLYGLRIGAQIALSANKANIDEFFQANKFSSRAKWSTANNMGMNIVSKIFLNKQLRNNFELELTEARKILVSRATTFIAEAKKVDLVTLPFQCGFFITIPCENPTLAYERLVKENIHIVPLGNVLRVCISAISIEECRKLPKAIKAAIS